MPRPPSSAARTVRPAPFGERSEQTYARILELVIQGRIAPGERVAEAEFALRLGVSRTPVRDALDRLAREGFLVPISGGRRTQLVVAPLDAGAAVELGALAGAVEGVAVLAVSGMGRDRRRQLAAELAEVNDLLWAASSRWPRDVGAVSALMSEFHVVVMRACAGPRLMAAHDAARPHIQRYDWAYGANSRANYRASVAEHRAIIDAIGAGDGARARRLTEAHWGAGTERAIAPVSKRLR
jgi:DNA-binding GntR family transcriptional regulator